MPKTRSLRGFEAGFAAKGQQKAPQAGLKALKLGILLSFDVRKVAAPASTRLFCQSAVFFRRAFDTHITADS